MNNDLNNMAKRYKDEMMRLYHKSGQKSGIMGMGAGMSGNVSNSQISQSAADRMEMQAEDFAQAAANSMQARNAAGTPVPGVPGASFYGSGQGSDMSCSGVNSGMSGNTQNNVAANVNGNAGGNMTMPGMGSTQNNGNMQSGSVSVNVPMECECRFPTAESIIGSMTGSTGMIQPRTAADPMGMSAGAEPAAYSGDNAGISMQSANQPAAMPAADQSSDDSNSDGSALRSFIINSFPTNPEYVSNDNGEATGEIFPDFAMPADLPAESSEAIPQTRHFFPSIGWITITGGDNGWGYLQVEVFNERGAAIQGASVVIKKRVNGIVRLMRFLSTNRNGLTPTIALPAPLVMTLTAQSVTPFSAYEITVRARGYYTMRNIEVPIYAGSKLTQPIEMRSIFPINPIQPRDSSVG